MTKKVDMSNSMMLRIASTIPANVPELPEWYVEDYRKEKELDVINDEELFQIQVSWETYYRTSLALNIMQASARYEVLLLEDEPSDQTEH